MEPIEMCNKQDQAQIMKGKRTKRPRLPSPLQLTMASSTDDNNSGGMIHDMATTSTQDHHQLRLRESTEEEEEEDMANCLILLAQGHTRKPISDKDNKGYLYQCKTCDRCFPSFQALGGHRASHKKPKPYTNTEGKPTQMQAASFGKEEGERYELATTSTTLSLQISNGGLYNSSSSSSSSKSKVHECSICGAEFSSGQALGGHMRRHRTFVNNCSTASATTANGIGSTGNSDMFQEPKKPKNVLKLDLNLPAPDDDHRESKLSFSSKENVLVFSASSLVDCHY